MSNLTLKHLNVKRGTLTTTNNISATFQTGKVHTVLDPNGAGKSSLIKALFGEIPHRRDILYV